ncbi:MAG: hypothetical protein JW850_08605 [Thermoflexales bacterium]|nr:hypothetical protein [Thermoflexales bacterium]
MEEDRLAQFIDAISNWLATHKGAPVLFGVLLVIIGLLLQPFAGVPVIGSIARSQLLLHLGVIIGLLGVLIGDAL